MRNKKLIRKGKIGMTIVNPSEALHNAAQSGMKQIAPMQNALGGLGGLGALLGGQGGLGKQLVGSMGGPSGIAGMASQFASPMLRGKDTPADTGVETAVEEGTYALLNKAGPKGMAAAAALRVINAVEDRVAKKEVGVDRFGRPINSQQGAFSPTTKIAGTINATKDLIKTGDFRDFGATMARLTPAGFFLGATADQRTAAREGENYRNLLQQETEADRQRKIEAQRRSQELMADRRSAGWGTMYAKKGGKLPESCGCTKEKDGLDTDVFYAMPKQLFVKVLAKVNLPEKTQYNDKIKSLIKNSVPKGSNLRSFIESIGDDVKQFIEFWENVRNKV